MPQQKLQLASRRRLLQFLAASPLIAHGALAQGVRPDDPVDWAPRELDTPIADPSQAPTHNGFAPIVKKVTPAVVNMVSGTLLKEKIPLIY